MAQGCPAAQAAPVASIIMAQARGLQLDLLATGDQDRVGHSFDLFVDLMTTLSRTWQCEGAVTGSA